jgi:hypothetical protein
MPGELHNVSWLDGVRIESPVRAVTIPASLIASLDENLRKCVAIGHALIVYPMSEEKWVAECGGNFIGGGCSAMQAIANMQVEA